MNVAYSFHWLLNDADIAQVRSIIESLRQYAIDLGGEMVSELMVLPEASQVYFSATIPGATEATYGMSSTDNSSWSWNGTVIVSSVRSVGAFHRKAASLSIEVNECYAGMIFQSKKSDLGVVETEQRSAFDWTDF